MSTKTYRARFVQLVAQLDTVTIGANQLAKHVRTVVELAGEATSSGPRSLQPKTPKAPSATGSSAPVPTLTQLLDYYESTLKVLETLLTAVRRVPPFGEDPSTLDSAFFLVRDFRQRLARNQQAFQDAVRGRHIKLDDLYGMPRKGAVAAATGCYFCSRPVIANRFSEVKVKIDSAVREVMSCRICKEELESTKKVKVLYFMKDGNPTHWSDVPDYVPSEDFWHINKRDSIHKVRRLELVPTQTETRQGD